MEYAKRLKRILFSVIFLPLIQEICMQECGWAHRIERFMAEPEAMEGSWPWMVAITRRRSGESEFVHVCSGAMVTRKHVLTVANCIQSRDLKSEHIARIGHVDERLAQEYNVSQIVIHKNYVYQKYYGNIAVMTLSREVFSEDFNPVCLPTENEFKNLTGEFTTVVGWGTTSKIPGDNQTYPNLRERFGLLVIPNSRCEELSRLIYYYYFGGTFKNGITDEMMCTDLDKSCIGEPGSALLYEKEDQWYIVGLVSFTYYCEYNVPIGYVRVTEYLDWIQKNTKACGLAKKYNNTNEDGDVPYDHKTWPWMVAITLRRRDKKVHLCSGSMITSRHVLTSSRCLDSTDFSLYVANIGHVDETLAVRYTVSRIVFPPTYVRDYLDDDIAILTLTDDVTIKGFNPICLPPSREFIASVGESVALVGWGSARGNGPDYPILRQKFDLKVIPNSECNDVFSRIKYSVNSSGISDKMICTAYPSKCIGDLGSPLMYEKDGRWYVIGLMSFRFVCDLHEYPTAYTRVSEYLNWIHENIRT